MCGGHKKRENNSNVKFPTCKNKKQFQNFGQLYYSFVQIQNKKENILKFKEKKAGGYLLSRDGPSIIGTRELDFRVRDGNGYCLSVMATGIKTPD